MRVTLLRGKASPMALYGVETTPIAMRELRVLGKEYKHALTVGASSVANQVLALAAWGPKNPDPVLDVLMRRVRKLRL
eukprot:5936249-Alexandrium_andersonii.AAC.1